MVNRRDFLGKIGAGVVGLTALGWMKDVQAAAGSRPNIVIVIGDDMTWRDCEPYGNAEVKTPHMARLAREGMCLDAMFTATAMCAPTRQQFYTGLYPVRNGAFPNHSWVYDGVKSLPHHFRRLGYRVGIAGKTHFGPREAFPFETVGKGEPSPTEMTAPAEFINRDRNEPYLLVLGSRQPHVAWDKGDPEAYDPGKLTIPPYLVDCPETREALTQYYAEITYLDAQLGAVLKLVDDSGRRDETLVIFTSEQGAQLPFAKWTCYDQGLRTAFIVRWPGKVKPGTRTDAMTQYVDVVPTLIEVVGGDPSIVDTGRPDLQGRRGFDGRSFLRVLFGLTDTHRKYVFGVHTTRGIGKGSECYPIRSVRSRRYKYIQNLNHEAEFANVETAKVDGVLQAWAEKGKSDSQARSRERFYHQRPFEELYDLDSDPYELNNLAEDPAYAMQKETLKRQLLFWMDRQGDEGIATEMQAKERKGKYLAKHRKENQ